MSGCKAIPITSKKICIGDLKHKITLQVRAIASPADFDYGMDFTNLAIVWAAIQTVKGIQIFDGVNVVGTASHLFYIRYRSDITAENFVEYNSKKFRILETQNIDEDANYLLLKCAERGTNSKAANEV